MQVSEWLKAATALLLTANVESARIDSLILLEDETSKDRGWLLAHPEYELSSDQVSRLKKLLTRRSAHEPLAYIRGHVEFYGHTFVVNKDVLVPRPESETIISMLLEIYPELVQQKSILRTVSPTTLDVPTCINMADIGCGSGILGITASLELPNTPKTVIDLIDIDDKALEVAKTNVDILTSHAKTLKSDLLGSISQEYDLLLCNLPYVPDEYPVNKATTHEPDLALFSGEDGLRHYRQLFNQLKKRSHRPLYLLIESLLGQHSELEQIALKSGYKLVKSQDLIQLYVSTK